MAVPGKHIQSGIEKYKEYAESLPHSAAVSSLHGRIQFMNTKGLKTFGLSPEALLRGVTIYDLIEEEHHAVMKDFYTKLSAGTLSALAENCTGRHASGQKFPVSIYATPMLKDGAPIIVRLMIIDLDEPNKLRKELNTAQSKLAHMMDSFGGTAYSIRVDSPGDIKITFLSDGITALTGYSYDEFNDQNLNKFFNEILYPQDLDHITRVVKINAHLKEPQFTMRFRIFTKDGMLKHIWNQSRISYDTEGPGYLIEGVLFDITNYVCVENKLKQKEAEKRIAIEKSLKDMDDAVKELHHRVKNNLQIITSILKLESMVSDDDKTKEILMNCRNRVFSMAIVHEKLYRSDDQKSVRVDDYLTSLADRLQDEFELESKGVSVTCICDKTVCFDIDTSITFGLIVAEFLSNAFRYKYTGEPGRVFIEFCTPDENDSTLFRFTAVVTGEGIPAEKQEAASPLSSDLIENLTAQLQAQTNVSFDNGARYEMLFRAKSL